MLLTLYVDDNPYRLDVPQRMLEEGESFFSKMDRDMDGGWQVSREFVENLDQRQRCQVAADKLLGAMSAGNHALAQLMAGYILSRMPEVAAVDIDTSGEIQNTQFITREQSGARLAALSEEDARARAEKDVSKIYKVGRSYRYACFDAFTKKWVESEACGEEAEAERMREQAVARRFRELAGR